MSPSPRRGRLSRRRGRGLHRPLARLTHDAKAPGALRLRNAWLRPYSSAAPRRRGGTPGRRLGERWPPAHPRPTTKPMRIRAKRGPGPPNPAAPPRSAAPQPPHQNTRIPPRLQIRQHHGHRLANNPPTIDRKPMLTTKNEAGMLQIHQLLGGHVDRDLLVVPLTPTGTTVRTTPPAPSRHRTAVGRIGGRGFLPAAPLRGSRLRTAATVLGRRRTIRLPPPRVRFLAPRGLRALRGFRGLRRPARRGHPRRIPVDGGPGTAPGRGRPTGLAGRRGLQPRPPGRAEQFVGSGQTHSA